MTLDIIELFSDVSDPRVQGRISHKLEDVLFISLCTLISNGEDYEDMKEFGDQRESWLETFLELPNGIPSSDTFGRVLSIINPSELGKCLQKHGMTFFKNLSENLQGRLVNFDGKKIKGENPKSRGNSGLYILSAWVGEYGISIGQTKVEDKSNEVTAIPKLLNELEIEGSTVSIDAIGCQVNIATQIKKENKAEYLLAVKKNQKGLLEEIEDGFTWRKSEKHDTNWEYDHGRYETRVCETLTAKEILHPKTLEKWTGIQTLIRIQATRIIKEKEVQQTRFYISSEVLSAEQYNQMIRGHWSIENHLHWHLDVTFKEDACRARDGYAAENLNILRKFGLFKLGNMNDKLSLKKRRFRASLNLEYLEKILGLHINFT